MSEWHIRFGTAGTSDSFGAKGYKSSLDIPAYTAEMGLDAFEYQCGHGVRLGVDKAGKMAADAAERGHPVQRPRTLLYQYVQPRGRKSGWAASAICSRAPRSAARWAENASSSTRAAAANRAAKPPLKRRWTPCAVPWKRWTKPVTAT
mgnify:CR=1 FL=1